MTQMIFLIITIGLTATAVSQHPNKTLTNDTSVTTSPGEDDLNTYTDRESFTDVESENICKRVVIMNVTRVITFRVETRTKCQLLSEDCNEDGYKWVRSVGYRNLTMTERRSEHVCCDGFKNESGKCINVFSNTSTILNQTSGITEGETTTKITILMIALPVGGAAVFLVVAIAVIYKLKCSKKKPSEGQSYAHANPVYDSAVGQSRVSVDNRFADYEQLNHGVIADANTSNPVNDSAVGQSRVSVDNRFADYEQLGQSRVSVDNRFADYEQLNHDVIADAKTSNPVNDSAVGQSRVSVDNRFADYEQLGQSRVSVDNRFADYEQLNHDVIADAKTCKTSC